MKTPETHKLPVFIPRYLGETIRRASIAAVKCAKDIHSKANFKFGEVSLIIGPRSNPCAVVRRYFAKCKRLGVTAHRTYKHVAPPASFDSVLKTYKIPRRRFRAVLKLTSTKAA